MNASEQGHIETVQELIKAGANGNINIAGTLTEWSDVRIKENIKPLKSQLEIVNKLNPVLYNKIGFEENEIGFIAQEVKTAIDNHPEIKDGFDMWTERDSDGQQRVAPSALVPVLVKAIQELTARIEALESN